MPVCPKCGGAIGGKEKYCPECGAQLYPPQKRGAEKAIALDRRILIGALGVLAFAACAIVLLLLDSYAPADTIEARAAYSLIPSPSPTPSASPQTLFIGAWKAVRNEKNNNKLKPYVDAGAGAGLVVVFGEDGMLTGIMPQIDGPDLVESYEYMAEGDSIYDDFGYEYIDGMQYYTRVRYFFKNPGELRCVYLLNGREASDYIIFVRLEDFEIPERTETDAAEAGADAVADVEDTGVAAEETLTPPPATLGATARPVEY